MSESALASFFSKRISRRVALLLPLAATLLPYLPVSASGPEKAGTIGLESLPDEAGVVEGGHLAASGAQPWRVVYVVGEVDGVNGPGTTAYVERARANAAKLREMGVTVTEIYPPNDNWETVKLQAGNAHTLIYSGHGVYGWDGDYSKVGGFSFTYEHVHPDRVRDELRMLPGAFVVLNHACFSAGSSATDSASIAMAEAQRRVAMYSLPFLQAGLSGYFANNYYNFVPWLFASLQQGMTFEQVYQAYFACRDGGAVRTAHPQMPDSALWVDYDPGSGSDVFSYNHAFAGNPDFGFHSLLESVTLSPSLPQVRFLVDAESIGRTRSAYLMIWADSDPPPQWAARIVGESDWLSISPQSGEAGQGLTLTANLPEGKGIYQTTILIATEDQRVLNRELLIPVVAEAGHFVCIPHVR